jgi:hypothetical protein
MERADPPIEAAEDEAAHVLDRSHGVRIQLVALTGLWIGGFGEDQHRVDLVQGSQRSNEPTRDMAGAGMPSSETSTRSGELDAWTERRQKHLDEFVARPIPGQHHIMSLAHGRAVGDLGDRAVLGDGDVLGVTGEPREATTLSPGWKKLTSLATSLTVPATSKPSTGLLGLVMPVVRRTRGGRRRSWHRDEGLRLGGLPRLTPIV